MNVNVDTIQPVDSQAVRQAVQEHYAAVVSGSSTCCGAVSYTHLTLPTSDLV